jgi:hypothetical protein
MAVSVTSTSIITLWTILNFLSAQKVNQTQPPFSPGGQGNNHLTLHKTSTNGWVWTCYYSKVFGGRPVIISTHGLSHPGSSVAQLANQRAAREHSQRAGIST